MASFLSLGSSAVVFFLYCSVLITPPPAAAAAAAPLEPTELEKTVCKQTTDYKFCIDTLLSNPFIQFEGEKALAFTAFEFAFKNTTNTQVYIEGLLKKNSTAQGVYRKCGDLYNLAMMQLGPAESDIYSEDYSYLTPYAKEAAIKIRACDDAIGSSPAFSPLRQRNRVLRLLLEICVVIATRLAPRA